MTLLGLALVISRSYYLSDFERHQRIARDAIISPPIDLSKTGIVKFVIKEGQWSYENGIANLFLIFNRPEVSQTEEYWKKDFKLKIKINAYAITENKLTYPRLSLNYFMPNDEPMAKTTKLWAGWDDRGMEYLLGSVQRFPKEDLIIEVNVTTPDELLAKANPRLKIIGDYDPAVIGYIYMFRLLRDSLLFLCFIALFLLTFYSWKYTERQ